MTNNVQLPGDVIRAKLMLQVIYKPIGIPFMTRLANFPMEAEKTATGEWIWNNVGRDFD